MPSLPLVAAVGLVVVLPAALITLKLLVIDPYLGPKLEAIKLELTPQTLRDRVRASRLNRRSEGSGSGTDDAEEDPAEEVAPLLAGEAVGVLIDDGGADADDRACGGDLQDGLRRRHFRHQFSLSLPRPTTLEPNGRKHPLLSSRPDRQPASPSSSRGTHISESFGSSQPPTAALAADENAGRRHSPTVSALPQSVTGVAGQRSSAELPLWSAVKDRSHPQQGEERSAIGIGGGAGTTVDSAEPLVDLSPLAPAPSFNFLSTVAPHASQPKSSSSSARASSSASSLSTNGEPLAGNELGESWAVFAPAELPSTVAPTAATSTAVSTAATKDNTTTSSAFSSSVFAPAWPPSALSTPVPVDSSSTFPRSLPSASAPGSVDGDAEGDVGGSHSIWNGSDHSTSPSRPSSPALSCASASTAASGIFVDRPTRADADPCIRSRVGSGGWTPTDGSANGDGDEEDDGWSELGSVA